MRLDIADALDCRVGAISDEVVRNAAAQCAGRLRISAAPSATGGAGKYHDRLFVGVRHFCGRSNHCVIRRRRPSTWATAGARRRAGSPFEAVGVIGWLKKARNLPGGSMGARSRTTTLKTPRGHWRLSIGA